MIFDPATRPVRPASARHSERREIRLTGPIPMGRAAANFLIAASLAWNLGVGTASAAPAAVLREIASGLTRPVEIVPAGDGAARLFVVEQGGRIRIVEGGTLLPTPFLDLSALVSTGNERGLLGLAFHPRYAFNRAFFVFYTAANGDLTLARYLRSTTDARSADAGSGAVLLSIPHGQFANHNGGKLAFGPDGKLYVATGDGGSGGDPNNRSQDLASLLGKLLRIAVDGGNTYAIPADNPFAGNPKCPAGPGPCPEIWAYGLRNPWKFSFDRTTGDLFIGDVGQNRWEEIDYRTASSPGGANFGWRVFEGGFCFNPATGCELPNHVPPILQYPHDASGGFSVTGGYRYRGLGNPTLAGAYVYGDFVSRRIWAASPDAGGTWTTSVLFNQPPLLGGISSFGETHGGELLIADLPNGKLWSIEPALAIAPRSLAFPRTAVGAVGPVRTVSITNRSASPIGIGRVTVSGDFVIASNDCAMIAPAAVCRIGVRIVPAATGARIGALRIESDAAGGGEYLVGLVGNRSAGSLADFDGDGRGDLLWRGAGGHFQLGMLQGAAALAGSTTLPGLGNAWTAIPGDFDGDGIADLLLRNGVTGANLLWTLRPGGIKASSALPGQTDTNWALSGNGDFDGSEHSDLLWLNATTGGVRVWLMNGATVVSDTIVGAMTDPLWSLAGIGDLNGDGRADLVWRHRGTGENLAWLMNGVQTPSSVALPLRADTNWEIVRLGDFDANGKADIVWRNRSTGANEIWLMDGATVIAQPSLPPIADQNWIVAGSQDYDGDGRSDLLWYNPAASPVVWFMSGAGRVAEKFLTRLPVGAALIR